MEDCVISNTVFHINGKGKADIEADLSLYCIRTFQESQGETLLENHLDFHTDQTSRSEPSSVASTSAVSGAT